MKKEIYICDHCGKEIDRENGFTEHELDDLNFYIRVDLCNECYQELSKYVYDFVRKSEQTSVADAIEIWNRRDNNNGSD